MPAVRRPLSDGAAEQLVESVFLRNFCMTRRTICSMKPEGAAAVSIRFLDPDTRKERLPGNVKRTDATGISVAPDDR